MVRTQTGRCGQGGVVCGEEVESEALETACGLAQAIGFPAKRLLRNFGHE
ncbi:hypothetical protein GCM10010302_26350 [Streptomyces polychromogenes]|uniref:Uncharacterized protein n=1 Tax=Streptomyces polychromogenes TaxID=67342 RepID=A0ABN0VC87_9ACTN